MSRNQTGVGKGARIPAMMLVKGDSVAVVLQDVIAGQVVQAVGVPGASNVVAQGDIPQFHKVSMMTIPKGATVIRNGVAIGRTTAAIAPGDWVHVHNLVSLHAQPMEPDITN